MNVKNVSDCDDKLMYRHHLFTETDRIYGRQYSAPIFKRKTSRFGLGQLIGYTLPNNSIAGEFRQLNLQNFIETIL